MKFYFGVLHLILPSSDHLIKSKKRAKKTLIRMVVKIWSKWKETYLYWQSHRYCSCTSINSNRSSKEQHPNSLKEKNKWKPHPTEDELAKSLNLAQKKCRDHVSPAEFLSLLFWQKKIPGQEFIEWKFLTLEVATFLGRRIQMRQMSLRHCFWRWQCSGKPWRASIMP